MSEIKALEKLRKLKGEVVDYRWGVDFDRTIDVLEAEIEREWMRVPVDADNVPIRVGDVVEFGENRNQGIVKAINEHMVIAVHVDDVDDGYINYAKYGLLWNADACRHVRERTIEDVLQDAMQYGHDDNTVGERAEAQIAKYADEIRAMFGEVNE